MATPAPPIADHQVWPPVLPTLTDELLEEIFLRLPTPAALARASTACASFRRIITDRYFLCRFRAVHPPPLLGFVPCGERGFLPAQQPHPSAPLARALAGAADFSYSFVPSAKWHTHWSPRDVRHGRVLLQCSPDFDEGTYSSLMTLLDVELAVCDPVWRRYVLLPPIPVDLSAQHGRLADIGLFLATTGDDEEETSFRVICTGSNKTNLVAFVYSSVTGHWCIAASPSWSSLRTAAPLGLGGFSISDYSQGFFFWTAPWREKLLVLDAHRMEFSIVPNVPYRYHKLDTGLPCIVVGTEGTPEMFLLGDSFDLLHFHVTKQNGNEPYGKWQLENTIPLPSQYNYYLTLGAAEGLLFLRCVPKNQSSRHSSEEYPVHDYCLLDIRTSEFKKVCGMPEYFGRVHAYFGFPPSLSKPCI
ncbi:hypothetical protein ACP70R_004532 [Stipagrostis hirtigluma subsp. patula]